MLYKDQMKAGSKIKVRTGQLKSGVPWIGGPTDKPADWDHIDALTFTPEGFWEECVEGSKNQKWITPASWTSRGHNGKGWIENGFRFTPQEFC